MNATMKNKDQLKYYTKFNIWWGFCVWLYNSIPHFSSGSLFFQLLMDIVQNCWWKGSDPKKTTAVLHTQQTLKGIFLFRFSFARSWKCLIRELEPWRKTDADCSFDLRVEIVWFSRKLCAVQLFRFFNSSMVNFNFFVFSNFQPFSAFFNLFQLFLLVFSSFFNLFQLFSTLFLNFKLWKICWMD